MDLVQAHAASKFYNQWVYDNVESIESSQPAKAFVYANVMTLSFVAVTYPLSKEMLALESFSEISMNI